MDTMEEAIRAMADRAVNHHWDVKMPTPLQIANQLLYIAGDDHIFIKSSMVDGMCALCYRDLEHMCHRHDWPLDTD